MESNIDTQTQRAILVGVQIGPRDIDYYMKELEQLAEAAGLEVVGVMTQKADRVNPATYMGKGKLEELQEAVQTLEADVVILNNELSGRQIRNLEDATGVKVIDRTILILDIFAARAVSREGKLQVELAQLQYRMPRLVGFGKALSRTGGGIGTRGPGEKKLETDRRHIARQIDEIRREIESVKATREVQRSRRNKSGLPIVAIAGYTNAGKSTLMNALLKESEKEDKDVFVKDMLFATLDTSLRKIRVDTDKEFILIDTVGFVSDLPHTLVNAFRSTLEEILYADLILHVVDASYEDCFFNMKVADKVLDEIGAEDIRKFYVFNKIDKVENYEDTLPGGPDCIFISAKNGTNLDVLMEKISGELFSDRVIAELMIPYDQGRITSYLCDNCKVLKMEYKNEGTYFEVELSGEDYGRLKEYLI
ncbi:MAG: GTPase HflX [Firmicutes bacterium]|jgi:GTP-binding protein HflX|nr:GTPase HflX [Bacillota bacterium]MBR6503602.1 GTPase HflX [Bacillota bacterium]